MVRTAAATFLLLLALTLGAAQASSGREPTNTVAPGAVLTKLNTGNHNRLYGTRGPVSTKAGWQTGAPLPDGGYIMFGHNTTKRGMPYVLARYNRRGRAVKSFGNRGQVKIVDDAIFEETEEVDDSECIVYPPSINPLIKPIALRGKTIQFGPTRLRANGSRDMRFGDRGRSAAPVAAAGTDGTLWGIKRGGTITNRVESLIRMTPDGRNASAVNGLERVHFQQIMPGADGSIYAAYAQHTNGDYPFRTQLVQINAQGTIIMRAALRSEIRKSAPITGIAPNPDGGVDIWFDAFLRHIGADGTVSPGRRNTHRRRVTEPSHSIDNIYRLPNGGLLATGTREGSWTGVQTIKFDRRNRRISSRLIKPPFAGGYASPVLNKATPPGPLAQGPLMYSFFDTPSVKGSAYTMVHPDGSLLIYGAASAAAKVPQTGNLHVGACDEGQTRSPVQAARGAMARYRPNLKLATDFGGRASRATVRLFARDQKLRLRNKAGGPMLRDKSIGISTRTNRPGLVRITAYNRGRLIAHFTDISYGVGRAVTDVRLTPEGRELFSREGAQNVSVKVRFRDLLGTYSTQRTARIRVSVEVSE